LVCLEKSWDPLALCGARIKAPLRGSLVPPFSPMICCGGFHLDWCWWLREERGWHRGV